MSESLKALNNIRTLRAQARDLALADLEEMLEEGIDPTELLDDFLI